jgi:hypothetical protein
VFDFCLPELTCDPAGASGGRCDALGRRVIDLAWEFGASRCDDFAAAWCPRPQASSEAVDEHCGLQVGHCQAEAPDRHAMLGAARHGRRTRDHRA